LKNLSTGEKRGDPPVDGSKFKNLDILVKVGALARVSTPPLLELPGWTKRAEKLAGGGIITVEDLLDADPKKVARLFGYKTTSGVERWKTEVVEWLKPPTVKKSG
jgi:hypothetical protein